MNPTTALIVRRARLLAVLAGLAWVLGLTPAPAVRLLVVGLVAVGTVLDALSDATVRTAAIRITTLRGRRP